MLGQIKGDEECQALLKYNRKAVAEIVKAHAQKHFGTGGVRFDVVRFMETTTEGDIPLFNDDVYVEVRGNIDVARPAETEEEDD